MFKNSLILVGTDFSPASDLALKAGEMFRRNFGGKLHVVHVAKDLGDSEWTWREALSDHSYDELQKKATLAVEKKFSEQIKRCEVVCTQEVLMGRPYQGLLEATKMAGASLLILGHKGAGIDHFFMGGLTEKMVASADVPVLVVNRPLELKKVAGMVDPMGPVGNIFSTSEALASLVSAKLTMISLWKDISVQTVRRSPFVASVHETYTEEEREKLINEMSVMIKDKIKGEFDLKVAITQDKNLAQALVTALEEEQIDLGIISRQKKGAVEKFIIGSTTRKVLDLYKGNLLVLPPNLD